jgi:hypothetical protein
MNVKPQVCPKCQGEMVQGFVADYAHGNAILVSSWVEGPPVKSFLGGIKLRSFWSGAKVREQIPIGTFRCAACGYLESYAQAEFGWK